MKKTTALLAAALVLAACGEVDPAEQFRDALPKSQAVQVGTPQAEGGTAGALSVRRDALGDTPMLQSEYAVMSYYLALTMNTGVAWTLTLLQLVTAFPPSACDDAACTWGPWVDDDGLNRWMLVVTKVGDAYEYALSAQPGSNATAPFVDILFGTAYPVDRIHGSGTFTVDFDAQDALDHGPLWVKKDFGQLGVDYDNRTNVSVGAVFTNARNDDPQDPHLLNAAYAFDDAPSGGVLQIAFENLDSTEVVSLRTRWSAGGAGRADAHYDGPDGAGGRLNYFASECWAGHASDFAEVYDSKHLDIPALADESQCSPFSSPQYADVVLP
jgi:hypothetical protein